MTLPLTMRVPDYGRECLGIGRDAAYAAAERGEIPTIRVGRNLVVVMPAALKQNFGMSDDLIAITLGLAPDSTNDPAGTAESLAEVHALTKDHERSHHAPDVTA